MNYKEFLKNEYVESSFDSPIGELHFSKERNLYSALQKRFRVLSKESQQTFSQYCENYKDWKEAYDNILIDARKSVENSINDVKAYCISQGMFDINGDKIYELAVKNKQFDYFEEQYNTFKNEADSTMQALQQKSQANSYQIENRDKWTGTDTKSSLQAGALNLAEGAALNILSAWSESNEEKAADKELNRKFRASISELSRGILFASYRFVFIVINEINNNENDDIDLTNVIPTDEEKEKVSNILENLKSGFIGDEQIPEICRNLFDTNPYDSNLYEFLADKYGDDGNLTALAEFFDVSGYTNYKLQKAISYVIEKTKTLPEGGDFTDEEIIEFRGELEKYCESIFLAKEDAKWAFDLVDNWVIDHAKDYIAKNVQDNSDEEEVKQVRAYLVSYFEKMSVDNKYSAELINNLDDKLQKIDEELRTVDGFLCTTREKAQEAKAELPKIQEFMQSISQPDLSSTLLYEKELLEKKELFENTFSSELKVKYLETIDGYHKEFERKFCSTKLFKSAKDRTQAAQERALQFCKDRLITNMEQYEKCVSDLKEYIEPNLGITFEEATEAQEYLEKKRIKITEGGSMLFSKAGKKLLNKTGDLMNKTEKKLNRFLK